MPVLKSDMVTMVLVLETISISDGSWEIMWYLVREAKIGIGFHT